MSRKIVNVRISEELHTSVMALAREEGVTVSSVLRRALLDFVATGRIEPTGYAPDPPPRPPKSAPVALDEEDPFPVRDFSKAAQSGKKK